MKKLGLWLAGILAAMVMSGCSPVYHEASVYHAPKTVSGKQCVKRCMRKKSNCDLHCGADHQQCLFNQKNIAHHRYIRYVKRQLNHSHKVRLTEQDFMDSKKCDVNCQCTGSYEGCYKLCGGVVTKKDVCVENCD